MTSNYLIISCSLNPESRSRVLAQFAFDYLQKNAFVLLELIEHVQSLVAPQVRFALVGASMGGLIGRYTLAYMEANALPHRVATFMTFDTPHSGAGV